MNTLFLILLIVCHFLADFTHLATLGGIQEGKKKAIAKKILFHAWIHGFLMYVVALFFMPVIMAFVLGILQMILHFLIDYGKAKLNNGLKLQPNNVWYWYLFGLDQFLHILVIIYLAKLF